MGEIVEKGEGEGDGRGEGKKGVRGRWRERKENGRVVKGRERELTHCLWLSHTV